jgi:hypothetical protein
MHSSLSIAFFIYLFAVCHFFWPSGMWNFHSLPAAVVATGPLLLIYFKLANIQFCFWQLWHFLQCKSYTAEVKEKIIKLTEQNWNHATEREFSINETQVTGVGKKEVLRKAKCSFEAFWGPKTRKFPELQEKIYQGNAKRQRQISQNATFASDTAQSLTSREMSQQRMDWFMKQNNILLRRTSMCQKLPSDFMDKAITFHCHVVRMWQGEKVSKLWIPISGSNLKLTPRKWL